MAGDLWLSLIQLAGKIKRAEESMPRIRRRDDRELIDDFLDSGERLWERFNKLLKVCEKHMLKTAKRDRGSEKLYMGNNSGREFVETIFGRDRDCLLYTSDAAEKKDGLFIGVPVLEIVTGGYTCCSRIAVGGNGAFRWCLLTRFRRCFARC